MLIPPINSKGIFNFAPPFDTLIKNQKELKVTAVREILELESSEEKPYNTIYVPVGLTATDFKNDVDNNVPIVVLVTEGKEYIYVPANRILSMPDISGVKYQELIVAISLGTIPTNYDLTLVKDMIKNDIYDVTGINSTVDVIPTSAVILRDKVEHETFTRLLYNRASVTKSYKTLYLETLELLNKKNNVVDELEIYIKTKLQ